MDKKDLLILRALDENVRESYARIGKKARISKETVQYRIQRLEKEGILEGYWALPKLGNDHSIYKIFLRNKGLSKEEKETFESFVCNADVSSWFAKTTGSWSYIITLMSTEDWKNTAFLEEIFKNFSQKFIDIQIVKSTSAISLNEKYLYEKGKVSPAFDTFLTPPITLTKTEKAIVNILTKNARAKFTDMSKALKRTPEAIGSAFRQLMKKNALTDLKPRINHAKLGYEYYHLMTSLTPKNLLKIKEYFIQEHHAVFMMEHVGKYQLHIEIVCRIEEINNIVEAFLEKFPEDVSEYHLCKIEKEFKIKVNT